MQRPGEPEDAPPGGRAAERLRQQLQDRFGDDPANWPAGAREQLATSEGSETKQDPEQSKDDER